MEDVFVLLGAGALIACFFGFLLYITDDENSRF